jgi:hypothetical protein
LLAKTAGFAGFSYEITTLITVWFLVRVQAGPPTDYFGFVLARLFSFFGSLVGFGQAKVPQLAFV